MQNESSRVAQQGLPFVFAIDAGDAMTIERYHPPLTTQVHLPMAV
jgi:hypothetical protein